MTYTPLHRLRRKIHDIDSSKERSGITLDDYVDLEKARIGTEIADLEILVDDGRSCPDCGKYIGRYYGPVDFDGQRYQGGDFVCRRCTVQRGTHKHG